LVPQPKDSYLYVALQRDSNVGSAEAEEKRQLADLGVVAQQAAATLSALNTTAAALDEVEDAAAAVERAKGHADEQVGQWASSIARLHNEAGCEPHLCTGN
jgi:hypothetical protein